MVKLTDIAWLGGILEGEGCFSLVRGKHPIIRLSMTAGDTVTRVAAIVGLKTYRYRTSWVLDIRGAYAIQWMMTLYPYLGKQRKGVIADIIRSWRSYPYSRAPNSLMAKCHPDRRMCAFDLCQSCYDRQSYIKKKSRRRLTVEQWRAKVRI